MRILYLHITQNLGGVEKRFFSYFQYILDKENDEYTVLISRSFLKAMRKDLVSKDKRHKVIKYGFHWNKKGKLTRYIDYLSLGWILLRLRLKKFDIVHFDTSASRMFRNFFRTRGRVISAVTSPKDWLEEEISSSRFKEMVKSGFGVDCLDSNIQNAIKQKYPEYINKIYVSPCSFIAASLPMVKAEKEHAISFVGRLIPEKGADLLLNALPEIIEKTSYKVYILGNGCLKKKFESLMSENNWQDRVVLTYDENPPRYMQKTEIFLSLQRDENYPSQSLLEAMYCNNAIIATNVGLTGKLVASDNGILVNNSNELIDALCYFEANEGQLIDMRLKSYNKVTSNHTVDKFDDYLNSLYKQILK